MTVSIQSTLLHVRPAPSDKGSAAGMDEKLAASSLRVETVGDVYAALARLGRDDRAAVRAVFICIDVIGAAELEFFAVVRRVAREVPVYVYGDDRSTHRLGKAVELGAAGCVTDELIHDLVAVGAAQEQEQEQRQVHEPVPEQVPVQPPPPATPVTRESVSWSDQEVDPAIPKDEVDDSSISPGQVAAERSAVDDEKPSPADESAAPEGARVPWLRYADRPTRGAPRVENPTTKPADAQSSRAKKPDVIRSEPLLTEEELQALLGDDIAAIAPAQRTPDELMDMGNEEVPS